MSSFEFFAGAVLIVLGLISFAISGLAGFCFIIAGAALILSNMEDD